MLVDLVIIIILLVSILRGMMQGFIPQVFRLVGLIAAMVFAGRLGSRIYPLFGGLLSGNPVMAGVAVTLIAFLIIYIIFSIAGRITNAIVIEEDEKTRAANRKLGALLGAVKGVLFVFAVLLILDTLPPRALDENPVMGNLFRSSRFGKLVHLVNPVPRKPVQNLYLLRRVLLDPALADKAMEQEAFEKLINHEKIRRLGEDPDLRNAAESGDVGRVLKHPLVRDVLHDEELRQLLTDIDLERVLATADEQAAEAATQTDTR